MVRSAVCGLHRNRFRLPVSKGVFLNGAGRRLELPLKPFDLQSQPTHAGHRRAQLSKGPDGLRYAHRSARETSPCVEGWIVGKGAMLIVDAYAHIYSNDRKRYPPKEEPGEPEEPAAAEDLRRRMDEAGVTRAVFVQPMSFYAHLELLQDAVQTYGIRGIRPVADPMSRFSTQNAYRLCRKARDLGVVVQAPDDNLDRVQDIAKIASDLDDLRIVLHHCLMLNARQNTEATLSALKLLSERPNVYAKLTPGAMGSSEAYPHRDMHEPLKRVIEYFGPERCAWGACFPNARWTKGTSYRQNLTLFTEELGLSQAEQEAILGTTALRLWFPGAALSG